MESDELDLVQLLPISKLSPFSPPNFAYLSGLVKDLYTMFFSGDKYYKEKSDALLRMLLYCTASGDEDIKDETHLGRQRHRLHQLRRLISDDPRRFSSIEKAAEFAELSPSWFQKVYHDHFLISFNKDVIRIRIQRAYDFLRTTDWTISQILAELGYENESFFYRQFKQTMGLAPSQFREFEKRRHPISSDKNE